MVNGNEKNVADVDVDDENDFSKEINVHDWERDSQLLHSVYSVCHKVPLYNSVYLTPFMV